MGLRFKLGHGERYKMVTVKVTVTAKNVDQWSDKLAAAVMHKTGEETCTVHMSSSFVLVIADKGLSKGHLANVRRHYKNE